MNQFGYNKHNEKCAYATVLDNFMFMPFVIKQQQRLKYLNSNYSFIVCVEQEFYNNYKEYINNNLDNYVIFSNENFYIKHNQKTKYLIELQVLCLTEYDKIYFTEADIIFLQNQDSIFDNYTFKISENFIFFNNFESYEIIPIFPQDHMLANFICKPNIKFFNHILSIIHSLEYDIGDHEFVELFFLQDVISVSDRNFLQIIHFVGNTKCNYIINNIFLLKKLLYLDNDNNFNIFLDKYGESLDILLGQLSNRIEDIKKFYEKINKGENIDDIECL